MRTICDVCDSAAAIIFCAADEAALCRSCDEKFPGDKPGRLEEPGLQPLSPNEVRKDLNQQSKLAVRENRQNHGVSHIPLHDDNAKGDGEVGNELIDLNARPQQVQGQASINQEQAMDVSSGNNHDTTSGIPDGSFKQEPEK
uniref:B box-type domain-containing protein n=1 Tax=Gossypium raimondii TaxID=29730 RepID=A0A0D2W258_GOSRA|nr:hypothetical protein B456_013G032300 [Gossypium raimondii]